MELAADSSDGAFHGHLHRRSVLTLDCAGARAQLHALGRPRAAQRGPGHLCRRVCHWVGPVVGPLQLPPSGFRPGAAQRRLAGNFVADLLVERNRSAAGDFFPAKRDRPGPVANGHAGHVRRLEAVAVLWHSRAFAYRRPAGSSGLATALCGFYLPVSRPPVPDFVHGRSFGGPAAKPLRGAGECRNRWRADCQCHDRHLQPDAFNIPKPIETSQHLMGWIRLRADEGRRPSRTSEGWQVLQASGTHIGVVPLACHVLIRTDAWWLPATLGKLNGRVPTSQRFVDGILQLWIWLPSSSLVFQWILSWLRALARRLGLRASLLLHSAGRLRL